MPSAILRPTGAGSLTEWTVIAAATNWEAVGAASIGWVSATIAGTRDRYTFEDLPADAFPDRPWGKGNNPKTAVREFLKTNDRFTIDSSIGKKLLITVAPEGYLKCVSD